MASFLRRASDKVWPSWALRAEVTGTPSSAALREVSGPRPHSSASVDPFSVRSPSRLSLKTVPLAVSGLCYCPASGWDGGLVCSEGEMAALSTVPPPTPPPPPPPSQPASGLLSPEGDQLRGDLVFGAVEDCSTPAHLRLCHVAHDTSSAFQGPQLPLRQSFCTKISR